MNTAWDDPASSTPLQDLAAMKKRMDLIGLPPPKWIYPPLVRKPMPVTESDTDPRWHAWNGVDHLDQTDSERQLAAMVREQRHA